MGKLFVQLLVLVGLFCLVWFGLSKVNFMKILHLDGISRKTENKIGELIIDRLDSQNEVLDDDSTKNILNIIRDRMSSYNSIPKGDIKIHLVESDQVNAFAIPGHNIIVYTGLINHCDSVQELCGVLAHEMGHIQKGHIMSRLISELGIGIVVSVASGNSEIAGKIIHTLSSSAFERKQESEADAVGVQYLQNAHINPGGFVSFMLKIAVRQSGTPAELEWISSHPDSKKRAAVIQGLIDTTRQDYVPVLTAVDWDRLKSAAAADN